MLIEATRNALSDAEKIAYTDAVVCMQNTPSLFDAADVPGAKTRYDDFVAVHINQTLTIHGTVRPCSVACSHCWANTDDAKSRPTFSHGTDTSSTPGSKPSGTNAAIKAGYQ